jgi:hypothetical protein
MTLVIPTAGSLRGEPVLTPGEAAAAIAMAARAPSVHNTQPWKFRICGDAIELLADPEVAPELLAALVADAAAEGSELTLIDEAALVSQLAELTEASAADQRANPALTAELRRWVRPPGSQLRDGVPARAIARSSDRPEAAGPYLPPRDFGEPGRCLHASSRGRLSRRGIACRSGTSSAPDIRTCCWNSAGQIRLRPRRAGHRLN